MPLLNPIMSDPALAISKEDQHEIAGAVFQKVMQTSPLRYLMFLVFILSGAILIGTTIYLQSTSNNFTLYFTLLWSIGLPINGCILAYLYYRFGYLPKLRQELHSRGYDICLKCSYILIDIPQDQTECPECGTTRTPLP